MQIVDAFNVLDSVDRDAPIEAVVKAFAFLSKQVSYIIHPEFRLAMRKMVQNVCVAYKKNAVNPKPTVSTK